MTKFYTSTGEEHGLIHELPNRVKVPKLDKLTEQQKKERKKLQEKEAKMVRVRYINRKNPGQPLTKDYMRWAGEPLRSYKLLPDHVYEVPYGLVEEVNGTRETRRSGEDINQEKGDAVVERKRVHELVPASFE